MEREQGAPEFNPEHQPVTQETKDLFLTLVDEITEREKLNPRVRARYKTTTLADGRKATISFYPPEASEKPEEEYLAQFFLTERSNRDNAVITKETRWALFADGALRKFTNEHEQTTEQTQREEQARKKYNTGEGEEKEKAFHEILNGFENDLARIQSDWASDKEAQQLGLSSVTESEAQEALEVLKTLKESKENLERYKLAEKRADVVIAKVMEKYQVTGKDKPPQLADQLIRADMEFNGLENLRGKRILDLGSGSVIEQESIHLFELANKGDDSAYQEIRNRGMFDLYMNFKSDLYDLKHRMYEPWFSRALHEIGAEPVGIDVGNLEGETFEHYQLDLSKPGVLDFLPDKSFDAINIRQLFSSPQLERMDVDVEKMQEEIQNQAQRLLKDDGKMLTYGRTLQ